MTSSEIGKADNSDVAPGSGGNDRQAPVGGPLGSLLSRHPWLLYVLPFLVFMLVGQLEPTRPAEREGVEIAAEGGETPPLADDPADSWMHTFDLQIEYRHYPLFYTAKIVLTVLAMALVAPGYRAFPLRFNAVSLLVGVVGVVLWVGLCHLRLEERLLVPLGLGGVLGLGERSAFNPFAEIDSALGAWAFLSVRFFGLVVVVAVIEEFFVRGFLMRFAIDERWWEVPFGTRHLGSIALGTAATVLMHPAEMLAALVWFTTVTWLMLRTRNIWDCVIAHAVTNLLLGLYVVGSDRLLGTDHWFLM